MRIRYSVHRFEVQGVVKKVLSATVHEKTKLRDDATDTFRNNYSQRK